MPRMVLPLSFKPLSDVGVTTSVLFNVEENDDGYDLLREIVSKILCIYVFILLSV